jgi:hypothetical protein
MGNAESGTVDIDAKFATGRLKIRGQFTHTKDTPKDENTGDRPADKRSDTKVGRGGDEGPDHDRETRPSLTDTHPKAPRSDERSRSRSRGRSRTVVLVDTEDSSSSTAAQPTGAPALARGQLPIPPDRPCLGQPQDLGEDDISDHSSTDCESYQDLPPTTNGSFANAPAAWFPDAQQKDDGKSPGSRDPGPQQAL